MTDAYECDRCGELYGEPPELKVATGGINEPAGNVSLKHREKSIGGAPSVLTGGGPEATYEIKRGDLCEECAEKFREFWGDSDD